jgi:pyruvate/2-oxoglutarate dehydrogenase complex dihydrolipoamide acyltransferase (E2) component
MVFKLIVPSLPDGPKHIRVLQWHKREGEAVMAGDLLVELETDKVIVEARAKQPGTLRRILCAEQEWHQLGTALALLSADPDEPLPNDPASLVEADVLFDLV